MNKINDLEQSATLGLKGATSDVRFLVQTDLAHPLASEPFLLSRAGVDFGLRDRRPIEHCHQLRGGRAVLRRQRSARLLQAVRGTLGKPGLVAAIPEPAAKTVRRERLFVLGLQKR